MNDKVIDGNGDCDYVIKVRGTTIDARPAPCSQKCGYRIERKVGGNISIHNLSYDDNARPVYSLDRKLDEAKAVRSYQSRNLLWPPMSNKL